MIYLWSVFDKSQINAIYSKKTFLHTLIYKIQIKSGHITHTDEYVCELTVKFPLASGTVLSMAATVTVTSVAPSSSSVMFLNSVTLSVVSFSYCSQTHI